MFSMTDSKTNWQQLPTPTLEIQNEVLQIIEDYGRGKNDLVLSQSKAYQYYLEIKTVNANNGKFQINLSRKEKGSIKVFEALLTTVVHQGKIDSCHGVKETDKDVLLTLFKGASVRQLKKIGVKSIYNVI